MMLMDILGCWRYPLLCERKQNQAVAAVIVEFVRVELLVQPVIRGRVAAVGSEGQGLPLVVSDFEFHVTLLPLMRRLRPKPTGLCW